MPTLLYSMIQSKLTDNQDLFLMNLSQLIALLNSIIAKQSAHFEFIDEFQATFRRIEDKLDTYLDQNLKIEKVK